MMISTVRNDLHIQRTGQIDHPVNPLWDVGGFISLEYNLL